MMQEGTIKAPENPKFLALANAIRNVDARTKGSPANLLVPSSLGHVLSRWGYGEGTSTGEKILGALDVGTPSASPADLVPLLGTFIGPKAGKETMEALAAMLRLDRGENAAKVWRETGWGAEPISGTPIKEISDHAMKLKLSPSLAGPMDLEYAIDHPELFDAIPELKYALIEGRRGTGGSFTPSSNFIKVGIDATPEEQLSTILHEAGGHGAQKKFGLLKGSSPKQFGSEEAEGKIAEQKDQMVGILKEWIDDPAELKKVRTEMAKSGTIPDKIKGVDRDLLTGYLKKWNEHVDEYFKATDDYKNTAGEAMARLTEGRRMLSPGERLEDYPFDPTSFERLTRSKLEDLWDPKTGDRMK